MRILIHDFGGYPFPVELARELAARGHVVTHSWCASLIDTPGAAEGFKRREGDSSNLEFRPVDLGEPLDKHRLLRRRGQERRYGELAADLTETVAPEAVLAANVPLDALARLEERSRAAGAGFVVWLQDLIGIGTGRLLGRRLPGIGQLVGNHYSRLEAGLLRDADAIVAITDDFRPALERFGVEREAVTTIENWAPLAELPVRAKDNEWARSEGLEERFVFAYTGAIGVKQDREAPLRLAERFRDRDVVRVLVVSGDAGARYVKDQAAARGLENLLVRDFVPWEQVPDVMGAADVLVATLHADAGEYSVPSKVLAYLCAARPLLVSVPAANLAARIVERERAGLVASPGDEGAFLDAAARLLDSPGEREEMGAAGRRYAEATFAISPIARRFEAVLEGASRPKVQAARPG